MNRRPLGLLVGISVVWIPLAFLSDGITVLVLPLRLGAGADASTLGLVTFGALAAGVATQPVAGWAGDRLRGRLDRRAFLVAGAIPALAGLALIAGAPTAAAAIVGYLIVTIAASAIQAGQQALIPEKVARGSRGVASGLKTTFDVGGSFAAFLVLGLVVAAAGIPLALGVTAVVLLVALVVAWALVPPEPRDARSTTATRSLDLPPGFVALVAARFLFLFGTYAVGRFLLLLVAQRLGLDPATAADEAGGLLALFTLVTAAAALPAGTLADRAGGRPPMVAGALVSAAGIAALAPPLGVAGIVTGGLLMAVGTALFMAANWAATTALVEPAEAGRTMGIANIGTGLAAACAGLLGPVIDLAGFAPALALAALVTIASIVPLTLFATSPQQVVGQRT